MSQSTAEFRHYAHGPSLLVVCCQFQPTYRHQVRALKKDSSGWHSVITTAYCLKDRKIDIGSYINKCIPYALDEICESTSPVSIFFRIARVHGDVRIAFARFDLLLTSLAPSHTRLPRALYLSTSPFHRLANTWL